MPLPISILGVTGKMGKCVLEVALQDPEILIVSGIAHNKSQAINTDLGDLIGVQALNICVDARIEKAFAQSEVAIDFSVKEATLHHIKAAQEAQKALVIGTTGQTLEEMHCIEKASQDIPIIISANFSMGIFLCLQIASSLSGRLFGNCHIDIFETHHIHKKDRPSGTALAFAHALGKGDIILGPSSSRNKEEITIHSTRSGETIGEHLLVFECGHERIEIKHTAHSRKTFAQGALLAAKLLTKKPPGLYSLKDLFESHLVYRT